MYRLRQLQMKDAQRMLEWMHDDNTMKYLRFDGKSRTIEDAENFIAEAVSNESVHIHRAIVDGMDQYCGTISLKNIRNEAAEFAIVVHPDSIGKGAGGKATRDILREAFAVLNLEKVYLNVLPTNVAAIRVYEKSGFRFVRSSVELIKGTDADLDWYEIKRDDWL